MENLTQRWTKLEHVIGFQNNPKKNLPKNADVTNQVFGRRVCLKILNQNIMFKYRTNFHVSVTK